MKKFKTIFIVAATLFLIIGCKFGEELYDPTSKSRSENLDFIFSTKSVGKVTITMKRSEWNQMLKNYDYFYKNENCVEFTNFEYEKNGVKWNLSKGGGIRLRGNTSRFRPQGKDSPYDKTGHHQMNEDWSKEYYEYAKSCNDNDYRQSHFKIDFEEFLKDGDEQKLAGCIKGIALKRMDSSCTKEIFCYDLFHRYGIWTAPRASHTRVFFKFIEPDGKITTVDYGVYEMFEEVNKQSLKARDKDENNAPNAWKNSKGNLWKCAGGDLANPNASMYCEDVRITKFDSNGNPIDFIWDSPTYDLKTNKDNVEGAASEFRQFISELNALPNVSNSNDKASINEIKAFYEKWMDVEFFLKTYAINILVGMDDDYWANANNYYLYFADTPNNGRKVYYIPFDYDNTLGASIKNENGKVGIEQNPFEWGRGANRPLMDKLLQVPEYRQLFAEKLIEVSAPNSEWNYEKCSQRWYSYWNMVSPYLNSKDLSNFVCTKGYWDNVYNFQKSLVNKDNNIYDYTRECILSYLTKFAVDLNGGNLNGETGKIELPSYDSEIVPSRDGYMFLGWTKTRDGNDFVEELKVNNVYYARWQDTSQFTKPFEIFEIENSSKNGICIGIYGMPENTNIRRIYINDDLINDPWGNGTLVSEIDNYNTRNINKNIWFYPYVKAGKEYKIKIVWLDSSWSWIAFPEVVVTAKSGMGENFVDFGEEFDSEFTSPYSVDKNNNLTWKYVPKVYIANRELSYNYMPGEFNFALRGGGQNEYGYDRWDWYGQIANKEYPFRNSNLADTWRNYFATNSSWNSNSVESLKTNPNLYLNIYYLIPDSVYGDYRLEIINDDYRENRYFSFN